MGRVSVGVLQHIEISFTDVQYLKQTLWYSLAKWSLSFYSYGKHFLVSQSALKTSDLKEHKVIKKEQTELNFFL